MQVQHLSHRGGSFFFRLLVGVDVDVQRGSYIGMTKKFLNLLDVYALCQKQAACRMAQVMETDFRQVVLRQQFLKVVRNVARQDNTPVRSNTHEIGVVILVPVFALICLLLRFQALEVSDYLVHHAKHTMSCNALVCSSMSSVRICVTVLEIIIV